VHSTARDDLNRDGRFVYLDHNATTPVDPRVLEEMLPYFSDVFGNPSSQHVFGSRASEAVNVARERVASLIGAAPMEIVFTSGATEAIATGLRATTVDSSQAPGYLAIGVTEHPAVLETADYLEVRGSRVDRIAVDERGLLNLDALEKSLANGAMVVAAMAANNETGVVCPLFEVHDACDRYGALFFCDATQMVGKLPFNVDELGVSIASFSAHKIYGPKGVGALFIRRSLKDRIAPLLHGGGQEQGFRSGTLNVAGIVGFGVAAEIASSQRDEEARRLEHLKTILLSLLKRAPLPLVVNGEGARRLPGTLNVAFAGIDDEALLARLPDIAVSTGSACASAVSGPSPVLLAMGQSSEQAGAAIRVSLGRFTTEEDVRYAARRINDERTFLAERAA